MSFENVANYCSRRSLIKRSRNIHFVLDARSPVLTFLFFLPIVERLTIAIDTITMKTIFQDRNRSLGPWALLSDNMRPIDFNLNVL